MKTNRNLWQTATIAALILMYCVSAFAAGDVSECNLGANVFMKRVTYVPITESSADDLRADCTGNKCLVFSKGWLYYGDAPKIKDAPVLIYNHGHDKLRGEPCAIAEYFVKAGFVVFAPLRRGHVAAAPDKDLTGWQKIASSGVHIDDYLDNCQKKGNCKCSVCSIGVPTAVCSREALDVDYLRKQVTDVRDAIDFIKNYAAIGTKGMLADPNRIALLGHSYGGSLTIFANRELDLQNTAIAVSAAELSWDSDPIWENELGCAMRGQQRPVYLLQPKNGRSLAPTKTLFGIAVEKEFRSQATVFPNAPCSARDKNKKEIFPPGCDESEDKEFKQAHSTFIGRSSQVALWGPSVIDFINRHPR